MSTLRNIVANQVNHIETDFVPYTLEFEKPVASMLNEHFGSDNWQKQLLQSVHLVGGTFDSWDTMEGYCQDVIKQVDAYGSQWTLTDVIQHLDSPILDRVEYASYQFPTLKDFLKPGKWARMVQECEAHEEQYPVALAGAGPYELCWRLMGVERMLENFICEPEMMRDVIERISALLMTFIDECSKLNVEAIMLGDDWCDQRGCMIGIERWRRFFKPYYKEFYSKIHKCGKKTVQHVCGNVSPLIPDLIEIGLDVLESVQPEPQGMDPYYLKKEYGGDLAFWGGLGCQSIVTFGKPAEIAAEVRKLRYEMSKGGGYILSPSKTINNSVSLENAIAIYETFIEENMKFGHQEG